MRATLYVTDGCAFCARLRGELREAGRPFEEINVSRRRETIPELLKLTRGKRVVPVLVDERGVHVAPFGGTIF